MTKPRRKRPTIAEVTNLKNWLRRVGVEYWAMERKASEWQRRAEAAECRVGKLETNLKSVAALSRVRAELLDRVRPFRDGFVGLAYELEDLKEMTERYLRGPGNAIALQELRYLLERVRPEGKDAYYCLNCGEEGWPPSPEALEDCEECREAMQLEIDDIDDQMLRNAK
jgi:hypothetical protein